MKVIFANQLRGVAVMMVVVSHLLGSYFFQKTYVSAVIGSEIEPRSYTDFKIVSLISNHYLNINFGPLGVSIFFLISGFVIMFSLGKSRSLGFIVQRWFRIFPTYWVSLVVCFIFTLFSANHFGGESGYFEYINRELVPNLFLYNDIGGYASMNFVNWSLTLEVVFYVIFATLITTTRNEMLISISFMVIASLLMMFYIVIKFQEVSLPTWILTALSRSKFIDYMCIGHAFYMHLNKKITSRRLVLITAVFLSLFWLEMIIEGDDHQMVVIGYNYIYGLVIFSLCYLYRDNIKGSVVLDFLANISYPVYLLHAVCGYSIISVMLNVGFGINSAFLMALVVILLTSWIMHKYIESPSNKFGKKITTNQRVQIIK